MTYCIVVSSSSMGGGVQPHFCPWGKMGKKVYGKKGKSIHFPLFPYTFFPHFSMGKNGVGPPFYYKTDLNIYHIEMIGRSMEHVHSLSPYAQVICAGHLERNNVYVSTIHC